MSAARGAFATGEADLHSGRTPILSYASREAQRGLHVSTPQPAAASSETPPHPVSPGAPVRAAAVLLAIVTASLFAPATPALAHTSLISSNPAADATVTTAPGAIELVFNQSIGTQFGAVAVTGPDGEALGDGEPAVDGATVIQALGAVTTPGEVQVSYRVASADGHPVTGIFRFTVPTEAIALPAPVGSPAPTARGRETPSEGAVRSSTPQPATATAGDLAAQGSGGGSASWVPPAVGALVVASLVAGAVAMGARRRRRSTTSASQGGSA